QHDMDGKNGKDRDANVGLPLVRQGTLGNEWARCVHLRVQWRKSASVLEVWFNCRAGVIPQTTPGRSQIRYVQSRHAAAGAASCGAAVPGGVGPPECSNARTA